jgi:ParB/RepB/Spo0J family partition protein
MTKTATAEQLPGPARAEHRMLPLAQLRESPMNHRRTWGDMDELVESVRRQGVLQPVLARPTAGGAAKFELVFGHRRFRAASKAGLAELPAMVREMTDVEVLEAQVVENVQRSDVHPLEEAEGYEQLLAQKEKAYTVEDIAARVGKSKAYVYGRMKLLALGKAAREAFYAGGLTASTALLVARIPGAELQVQALERLVPEEGEDPLSFREAARIVHDGFMLDLAGAPFATADAGLVKKAGPCATCPKRTGSQPDLFSDVSSGDVCTDPACFKAKVDATWERRAEEGRVAGRKVLDEKQAAGIFSDQNWAPKATISWDAEDDWADLDAKCEEDPKRRTWREVLGAEAAASTTLVRDPRGGIRELVPLSRKVSLLKKAGIDVREKKAGHSGEPSPATKEREAARKRELEVREAIETEVYARLGAAAEKANEKKVDPAFLRVVVKGISYEGSFLSRRAGKPTHTYLQPKEKAKILAKLGTKELWGVLAELAYETDLQTGDEEDSEILKFFKIDAKKVEAEVKARMAKTSFDKMAERAKTATAKKKGAGRG